MKIAYFDCGYGAAGDMLLGAMIAAGLPADEWLRQLDKIAIPSGSFRVEITDVERCSLAAKKVDVLCEQQPHVDSYNQERRIEHDSGHSHQHSHEHGNEHRHEHGYHSHQHYQEHSHDTHDHEHDDKHTHERGLPEILNIIEQSKIAPEAKQLASKIFTTLAEAEASVHGKPLDKVHFHEVGAIDAIIDIVGFAIGYNMLKIESATVSALPVGSGQVKTAHGWFPVPGPAVINILANAGIPVASSPFTHECLTPTGAAILSTVARESAPMPSMKISSAGYGAGTFNPSAFPNVCRIIIGESV
jgi:uncharacterized protein (DUF111 family)